MIRTRVPSFNNDLIILDRVKYKVSSKNNYHSEFLILESIIDKKEIKLKSSDYLIIDFIEESRTWVLSSFDDGDYEYCD